MNVGIKRDIRGELNITLGVCEVHIAVSWKKKDREGEKGTILKSPLLQLSYVWLAVQ